MSALKVENLTTCYQNKIVLENISFEAKSSEITVVMGTSGSGKTTLLLSILGIQPLNNGQIFLNKKNITSLPIEKRNIGYLAQDYGLFPHMTVQENVSFGLTIRGISEYIRDKKVNEILEMLNLNGLEKRKINELSGGQKQRVGLARALVIEPELLLLDEPLSNIDQVTKYEVALQLKKIFKEIQIPVVLITHSHEEAMLLSDQLIILIDGKIAQMGNFKDLLERPNNDFIRSLLQPFPL